MAVGIGDSGGVAMGCVMAKTAAEVEKNERHNKQQCG
jgi:hypothetical protein